MNDFKELYHIYPIMPRDARGRLKIDRFGQRPVLGHYSRKKRCKIPFNIYAESPEDALKLAVVLGHIHSPAVIQYFEAVKA